MKVLLICLSLCLSMTITLGELTCDCGMRNMVNKIQSRIVGGEVVQQNEYPWVALFDDRCGGSILTHWHILTAAHCIKNVSASDLIVAVGQHFKYFGDNDHIMKYKVAKIIRHEEYTGIYPIANDIAVLVTAEKINYNEYISPVCLPNRKINLVGEYIKILGWGLTANSIHAFADELREVDVQVIDHSSCEKTWPSLNKNAQLCTHTPGKDVCKGDSGGPLVYLDPDSNRYTQVSVMSFSKKACDGMKPSVSTDVYAYMDWINNSIKSTHPEEQICKILDPPESKKEQNWTSWIGSTLLSIRTILNNIFGKLFSPESRIEHKT